VEIIMGKPIIGLALGSGAARGWAHIGVIETLAEAGIVPDVVCGTSMGALVGGVYLAGGLEALKTWALAADWRVVASMIDVGLTAGGLVDGLRIHDWLGEMGHGVEIEKLEKPFAAVATDLSTGREIWLRQGALARAVRASIGMPGIFSPTRIEKRWLVDGGLVNPVPVSVCRALGAEFIIAVNLNEDLLGRRLVPVPPAQASAMPEPRSLLEAIRTMPTALRAQAASFRLFGQPSAPGYFDVLANALNIMQDHITRSRLAGEPPHAMILPRVVDIGLLDFHHAAAAIAEGRAATQRALPAILARLEGRGPAEI
jgi:NTE family protein